MKCPGRGTHEARGMHLHWECDQNAINYDHDQPSDFGLIFRQCECGCGIS